VFIAFAMPEKIRNQNNILNENVKSLYLTRAIIKGIITHNGIM